MMQKVKGAQNHMSADTRGMITARLKVAMGIYRKQQVMSKYFLVYFVLLI
jgi:hypothetical protein